MKKIITSLLLCLLFLITCNVYAALEQRWSPVVSVTPSMEIFIDTHSLVFEADGENKFVTAWVAYDDYQKGVTLQTYAKYNLTQKSYKFFAVYVYSLDGEMLNYESTKTSNYTFIPPNSNGENVLNALWVYWYMHRDGLI